MAIEAFRNSKKGGAKITGPKPSAALPKFNIPLLGKKSNSASEQTLAELKKRFSAGELSEEDYRAAVDAVLEKL